MKPAVYEHGLVRNGATNFLFGIEGCRCGTATSGFLLDGAVTGSPFV